MAICKAWPLLNNSNCQKSIIYHPVVDYDTSESIYCHRKSQLSRSQWRGADKFFMPSQALISSPAGTAPNLAHWKLLKWGLHNTNMPLKQTVRGKRLKTTAISLCNIHSMWTKCLWEIPAEKKKQEMIGQQKGGSDIVPHIPKLPGDGSAQVTEGSWGPLSCCGQGLRCLFVSARTVQKITNIVIDK